MSVRPSVRPCDRLAGLYAGFHRVRALGNIFYAQLKKVFLMLIIMYAAAFHQCLMKANKLI